MIFYKYIGKISTDDIFRRIAKGSFWALSGSIFSKIIILVTTMFLARILGQDKYGELGIIRSTVMMFVGLAGIGLGTTATKFIAENRDTRPEKAVKIYLLSNIFAFGVAMIAATLIFTFSQIICEKFLDSNHLINEVRLAALMLFLSIINGAQNGTLLGFEDFKSIAKINIVTAICEVLFTLIGAYFFQVLGAVLGYGFSFVITTLYYSFIIRKHIKRLKANTKKVFKSIKISDWSLLFKFSLPIAMSSLLSIPVFWFIKAYLIREAGYSQMAIFDVADQWKIQVLYIPTVLSSIILPIISNQNNKNDFWRTIKINLIINIITTLIISSIVALLCNVILRGYGHEFAKDNVPFLILNYTTLLISVSNIIMPILISKNRVVEGLIFNIISSVIILLCGMAFIDRGMGALGLSIALLLSYLVVVPLEFLYIYYKKKSVWN